MAGLKAAAIVGVSIWVLMLFVSYMFIGEERRVSQVATCSDISPMCIDLQPHCSDPEHRSLLRLACPVTCESCDQPLPEDFACSDSRSECTQIAASSRCDTRPLVFWRDCSAACRVCQSATASQAAAVQSQDVAPVRATTSEIADCHDHHADCAARAAAGECHKAATRVRMVLNCALSCNTCQRRQSGGPAERVPETSDDNVEPTVPAALASRRETLDGAATNDNPSGDHCADTKRACSYWVSVGECAREPDAMRALCPAGCGLCNQSAAGRARPRLDARVPCDAEDRAADCEEWAAAGECERGRELMRAYCPCSCRQPQLVEMGARSLARVGGRGLAAPVDGAHADADRCADRHERCQSWALIGLCGRTPLPMRRLCPKACDRCQGRRKRLAETLEAAEPDAGAAGDFTRAAHTHAHGPLARPQMHQRLLEWCARYQPRRPRRGTGDRNEADTADGPGALPSHPLVQRVPLHNVRLTPGSEFHAAQQLNSEYLLSLAPDRLLWSFRQVAGLPTPGTPYGAWEAAEDGGYPDPKTPTRTLRGHFVGHLLSGLALAHATSGDGTLGARAAHLVNELDACQRALGMARPAEAGFVSAWPSTVLDTLDGGDFGAVWAPWYTLHKVLAGLLDVHELVCLPSTTFSPSPPYAAPNGNGRTADRLVGASDPTAGPAADLAAGRDAGCMAIGVAQRLAGYLAGRVDRLRAEQGEEWWQATLEVEFGGIGEAAYRLAAFSAPLPSVSPSTQPLPPWGNATAAAAALRLARAFVKRRFNEPLARGRDALAGVHANTHLPLLVSAARGAEVEASSVADTDGGGRPAAVAATLLATAVQGYCTLTLGYSYAGALGSSVNEHWPDSPASTGRATRTIFAPEGAEDLVGGCTDLADAGECTRSPAYMLSHCAATCAADATNRRAHSEGGGEGYVAGDGESVAVDSDAFHTQESCTQYNALKTNLELFGRSPDGALADAFERKLLNGVLGIQHPSHPGKMVYMLPLGAGVSKEHANWAGWGAPEDSFWCCYGTGVESFAKLADGAFFAARRRSPASTDDGSADDDSNGAPGESIAYSNGGPELWVSQFVPSSLRWAEGQAVVTLSRSLRPVSCDAVTISLTLGHLDPGDRSGSPGGNCFTEPGCTLWLRLPSWAANETSSVHLRAASGTEKLEPLNGQRMRPGRFLRVSRTWASGDTLVATLGLFSYLEPLNDWRPQYESTYALLYGPYMLVGLTSRGEHALRAAPADLRSWVKVTRCAARNASWSELRFTAPGADGLPIMLMPLSAVVDQPYTAYFQLV